MRSKYTGLQIGLHWLVLILVVIAWLSMELRHDFPRSQRPLILTIHASCGISVGVLMVARLILRLRYPAPPVVPKPPVWSIGLAHLGHLAIWLTFLALPILGVLTVWFKGSGWHFFGISMPVAAIPDEDLEHSVKSWHELLANFSYWLIAIHAAAALLHHYWWRDNTLKRMMPGGR
ncbi:cytochrome b561 [Salmonella enterica subsp. enterica serovar Choleraesuis]|nr:cytochrome b561 [Salmonella enterica subsp. enterica serovar Choleraesuis]